jgi:splicing factor 3A subunit 1
MTATTTMAEEVNNDNYVNQTVGIIIPPPEIKSIVDKTAEFIAKSGTEFEQKLLQGNDPKFNFLRSEHPYNAYYREKIEDIFNGK